MLKKSSLSGLLLILLALVFGYKALRIAFFTPGIGMEGLVAVPITFVLAIPCLLVGIWLLVRTKNSPDKKSPAFWTVVISILLLLLGVRLLSILQINFALLEYEKMNPSYYIDGTRALYFMYPAIAINVILFITTLAAFILLILKKRLGVLITRVIGIFFVISVLYIFILNFSFGNNPVNFLEALYYHTQLGGLLMYAFPVWVIFTLYSFSNSAKFDR